MMINSVDEADDNAIYAYLLQTCPKGQELLSESEQTALLAELRERAIKQTGRVDE